jgi:hypothetical protein
VPIDISRMTLPEMLKHVADLPAKDRGSAIKAISNLKPDLKKVLQLTYHKDLVFDLPEGDPPYKPLDVPDNWGYNRMPKELRKVGYFLRGTQNNLTKYQKEKMFIDMLESVSPEEAQLFLMIKNKKITYKGITRKLIEESMPELLVGEKENSNVKSR